VGCPYNRSARGQEETGRENVIQKVGMITISAPSAINSRNASGNARSQQINMPTRPIGVSIAWWRSWPDEVKCGLSGCQMFFLR
jgi:hypothetical protein